MAPPPTDESFDPELLQAQFAAQLAEDGVEHHTLSPGVAGGHAPPGSPVSAGAQAEATATTARARLAINADPRLLALVEGRLRPEIVRTHTLPQYAGELPFHLDPAVWRTGFIEICEGGPPPDLRDGMREVTPQALLRDLFRPVHSGAPVPLDLLDLPLDPGGRAAFAELRAARLKEPLPQLERSVATVAAVQAERRSFLSAPWKPHLSDEAPRREVFVALEPSFTR